MAKMDISIAGEINLDLVLYGLPKDMRLDRELLASGFSMTLGSSSAILAHNLAALGIRTGFVTRVGPDEMGQIAVDRLLASGVDLSHIVRAEDTPTGVTVVLPHGRERHILTYPGSMHKMERGDLDFDYLSSARHFHLSSLFLHRGLQRDLPQLFRDLKHTGLTVSLDTNDDPEGEWGGVLDQLLGSIDILLPNEEEACRMTHSETLEQALAILSERVPIIAVKRGSQGCLVQHGKERVCAEAIRVDPLDTIGAGDSFNAGFLSAYLRGCDLEQAAVAGNIAGALSTLRPGGTEAFRDQVLRDAFLEQHHFPTIPSSAIESAKDRS